MSLYVLPIFNTKHRQWSQLFNYSAIEHYINVCVNACFVKWLSIIILIVMHVPVFHYFNGVGNLCDRQHFVPYTETRNGEGTGGGQLSCPHFEFSIFTMVIKKLAC